MASVHRGYDLDHITHAKVFAKSGFRVANAVSSDGSHLLVTISRENRVAISHIEEEAVTLAAGGPGSVPNAEAAPPPQSVPMHTPGLTMPAKPAQKKGGMMAMFSKKEVAAKTQAQRDELLGKSVDDRDKTSFLSRTTGAGGLNPTFEKLRLKMEERTEKTREIEERSAQMAQNGEEFGDAAKDLADYYRNKKWWEF
jgi:hypothetical protein